MNNTVYIIDDANHFKKLIFSTNVYTVNKNHSEGNSCIMDLISETYGINAARELNVECKDGVNLASRCT